MSNESYTPEECQVACVECQKCNDDELWSSEEEQCQDACSTCGKCQ